VIFRPETNLVEFEANGVAPSCVFLPLGPWRTTLDFLSQRFEHIPAAQWLTRMQQGKVKDEQGRPIGPEDPYIAQQKVFYFRELPAEKPIPFEAHVIYQDAHIVVADKPHFLPVTPAGAYLKETLLVRLKHQLNLPELAPMHRLDRETAGLVLLSVQAHERKHFHTLFREHTIQKYYEAIAPWHPELIWPTTVRCRIGQSGLFMQMCEFPGGIPNSETVIDMLQVNGAWARYGLWPKTGKKHQLRLHMLLLGIALFGDRIYPTLQTRNESNPSDEYNRPLQLLAKRLDFTCPITGQQHQFESQRKLSF
jgi:tRNA pseudouridine32 synthase / 23S rRNA pseudouridine746 synthase